MTARAVAVLAPPEIAPGDVVLTTPGQYWVNGTVQAVDRPGLMWQVRTDEGTLTLAPASWCEVLR